MKIIDLLIQAASRYPDRPAVNDNIGELSYGQILANVNILADHLRSVGVGSGVKVALRLPNSAAYLAAFFAISAAKATIVPLSSHMTTYELIKFINIADVSVLFTDKINKIKLANINDCKKHITLISIDSNINGGIKAEIAESHKVRRDLDDGDVALMVCTSGSTGQSKIVMLTDDQLLSNMYIYRAVMDFHGHNIVYCSLSLHHIYSICAQLLTHVSLGDTFIVDARPFFIKDFFNAVQNNTVTITAFVPYLAMMMAEYPDLGRYDISSLRYITLSGAKTPKRIYQKLVNTYPHVQFINTYGMSEAGSRIAVAAPNPKSFPLDSVGKPIPGVKVRITDEGGNILSVNRAGEVEVQSSGVCKGYYHQRQLTHNTIVNGWLKTGDLGRLDNDGNLYLVGRKKDIILCGGENIYPVEVEECLMENDDVREAAVIGIPDQRLQEVPCAFVVPKNGQPDENDLIRFCKTRLSSFKVPRKIYFIDSLPKRGISKTDHGTLNRIAQRKIQKGV
jgi:long-chain acyl-CoA synthetase